MLSTWARSLRFRQASTYIDLLAGTHVVICASLKFAVTHTWGVTMYKTRCPACTNVPRSTFRRVIRPVLLSRHWFAVAPLPGRCWSASLHGDHSAVTGCNRAGRSLAAENRLNDGVVTDIELNDLSGDFWSESIPALETEWAPLMSSESAGGGTLLKDAPP